MLAYFFRYLSTTFLDTYLTNLFGKIFIIFAVLVDIIYLLPLSTFILKNKLTSIKPTTIFYLITYNKKMQKIVTISPTMGCYFNHPCLSL